jgi:transposase
MCTYAIFPSEVLRPIHINLLIPGGNSMIEIHKSTLSLLGPKGSIPVRENDEITLKLAMLFEGQCEGLGPIKAAEKFGFTRQRYYQLLRQFMDKGAEGLKSLKPGPKGNYRRTDEVVRQVIRYRFLDPKMSPEVIAQKLNQNGFPIAIRSVERVVSEYGLQKKTSYVSTRNSTNKD